VIFGLALLLILAIALRGRMGVAADLIVLGAIALITLAVARRARTIQRLCAYGVEVEARLVSVDEEQGETSFRTATYRYEHDGRPYDLTVTGADFFMGFATRYGDHVIALLDPANPRTAVILRSFEPA
jgi:hypothetical protein